MGSKEKIYTAIRSVTKPTLGSVIRTMSGFDGTVESMLPIIQELESEGKVRIDTKGRGYRVSPVELNTSGGPVSEGTVLFKGVLDKIAELSRLCNEVSTIADRPMLLSMAMKNIADGLDQLVEDANEAKNVWLQYINKLTLENTKLLEELSATRDINLDDDEEADDGEAGVPRQGSSQEVLAESGQAG